MDPADFLMSRPRVEIFEGGSAHTGSDHVIGGIVRVILHVVSQHGNGQLSIPQGAICLQFIAHPGPSVGGVDQDGIHKSQSAFHGFWDEDVRVPVMRSPRPIVVSIRQSRHFMDIKIEKPLIFFCGFPW